MFCPECGTDHHAAERLAEQAEQERVNAEIEIKRLETKRDIEVARINAGAAKDISETEAEAEVAHAEGIVQGMETVLEAAAGGEEAEQEPVVIVSDETTEEEPAEEIADAEPPEAEPVAVAARPSNPWW